jgi:hypothetical protein
MNKRARLRLHDPDFVAVPLSRTELEELSSFWDDSDELGQEDASIWLKAKGALALLDEIKNEKA